MKFIILAPLLLVCLNGKAQEYSTPPEFAQIVYDDIFNTMNDGKVIKPKLVVSDEATEVATYDPTGSEPLIKLGVNFVQMIQNFGKDSSNALAHVLGHELAHVILRQNDLISKVGSGYASAEFNKKVKKYKKIFQDSLFERQADEYASIYAHIAGYKTTGLGAVLLDSIYKRFQLTDSKLSRYPTIKERKDIVRFSERKMGVLKSFFDASVLCAISENYEMSDALNRAIIQEDFPSREIHNNLGASSLIQAIYLLDTLDFPYDFPVAIDLETRLNTSQERAFGKDVVLYLNKAHSHLINATRCSPTYYTAWLNEAIVQFILGDEKLYSIALINLSDCSDQELLNKLEVVKAIKEDHLNKKKVTSPYATLCNEGNTYACRKLELKNEGDNVLEWPISLAFIKNLQNPKFDFMSEEAKKADTLNKALSVTKFDFHYRKLINKGIKGERWYYSKGSGSVKPVDIYSLDSKIITDKERSFLEDHCQLIGVFSKKTYLRWNDIFIVLNDYNAQFFYIN
jgi:hypothetical protein